MARSRFIQRLAARSRRFARREDGAITVMMLFFVACLMLVGGVVADMSNRSRVHTMLQTTADMAATSGAIRLSEPRFGSTPRSAARWTAMSALRSTHLNGAWTASSFELGRVGSDGQGFVPGWEQPDAVRVTLRRTRANGNAEPTMLLRMIGVDSFDIEAQSVARILPQQLLPCVNPLLSLKARVDVMSTDIFAGICLKASASVSYGAGGGWLSTEASQLVDGVLATALGLTTDPLSTTTDVVTRSLSGLGGLLGSTTDTVEQTTWETRNLAADLATTVAAVPNILHAATFSTAELRVGESYRIDCDENEVLNIDGPVTIRGVALYSACPVKFGTDVNLEMSLVVSNLISVLGVVGDLDDITIEPNLSLLRSGADCQPGDGVKIFLFLDANVAVGIPALVDPASPLGGFLEDVVGLGGGLLSSTLNLVGPILADLSDLLTTTTEALGLAKVCLDPSIMLTSETIQLQ